MFKEKTVCPICKTACLPFDVVDLNKSCEEPRGKYLTPAEYPIYYFLCGACGFCFAPEMYTWDLDKFEALIYNNQYVLVDPDYLDTRPRANAKNLQTMFPNLPSTVRHLDYGGGNGLFAQLLRESNWESVSYDPFIDRNTSPKQLGKFDLITAFEVFEHVPDVQSLMANLRSLLSKDGLVLFSTLLSDGNIQPRQRLSWWYASPRNGHVSLYSRKSLAILAQDSGFNFGSFNDGFHVFVKTVPSWASHILAL